MKRWLAAVLVGLAVGAAVGLGLVLCRRDARVDTSVVQKEIRFYKESGRWYADVPQHTQAQNQMVAGADALLDALADGRGRVAVVLSADVADPGDWRMWLHIVEHDRYGATYRVTVAGEPATRLIWLCNVMHTVFGGEHPTDVYVHSISVE
ncbi:MAG: hypothetical protein IJ829_00600 [Kiritimatiellae bacterium]|nr:hypothetical protein [Kiritimatiellia bacterium]